MWTCFCVFCDGGDLTWGHRIVTVQEFDLIFSANFFCEMICLIWGMKTRRWPLSLRSKKRKMAKTMIRVCSNSLWIWNFVVGCSFLFHIQCLSWIVSSCFFHIQCLSRIGLGVNGTFCEFNVGHFFEKVIGSWCELDWTYYNIFQWMLL